MPPHTPLIYFVLIRKHMHHPVTTNTLTAWSLFIFPVFCLVSRFVLPNDAAPLAVVLRALTINSVLFLCLHQAFATEQLNLASPCMGNGSREAALQLKIEFQVKCRFLLSPLASHSASQSNSFFPPFMNIYGEVSIWSRCRAKIRLQIKISPTSFPPCHFTTIFLLFLKGVNAEFWLTHDTWLFNLLLKQTQAIIMHFFCMGCTSIYFSRDS